jgi:hypothetical protein
MKKSFIILIGLLLGLGLSAQEPPQIISETDTTLTYINQDGDTLTVQTWSQKDNPGIDYKEFYSGTPVDTVILYHNITPVKYMESYREKEQEEDPGNSDY